MKEATIIIRVVPSYAPIDALVFMRDDCKKVARRLITALIDAHIYVEKYLDTCIREHE